MFFFSRSPPEIECVSDLKTFPAEKIWYLWRHKTKKNSQLFEIFAGFFFAPEKVYPVITTYRNLRDEKKQLLLPPGFFPKRVQI